MNTKTATKLAGMNSVTVLGLKSFLDDSLYLDDPLLIQGAPGIGKSDIVRQACTDNGYVLLDRRVSQMLPEDFSGIPLGDLAAKTTTRCIPDLVAEAYNLYNETKRPVCLFLDEVSNGTPQIHAALYEVVLDRRAGNYEFPPGTRVVLAGNRASDGASVNELPRPLLNRMAVVDFKGPLYAEWEDWAIDNGVHPIILTALKVQPEFLHGKFDPENERNPTCRSWAEASDVLHRLESTGRGHDGALRTVRMSAYVGDEAALKVQAIYEMASQLQDPNAIMTNPDRCPASKTLALGYLQTMQLVNLVMNVPQTKNAFSWVERTSPELMSMLVRGVMRRHNQMVAADDKFRKAGGLTADAKLLNMITQYGGTFMSAGASIRP